MIKLKQDFIKVKSLSVMITVIYKDNESPARKLRSAFSPTHPRKTHPTKNAPVYR